jgi:hypothetical protein
VCDGTIDLKTFGIVCANGPHYSDIENLVLWARSEIIGFASKAYLKEYWSNGVLNLIRCALFDECFEKK